LTRELSLPAVVPTMLAVAAVQLSAPACPRACSRTRAAIPSGSVDAAVYGADLNGANEFSFGSVRLV